jgi:nicotinic acid mononucleotide adenylyltransferase
MDLSKIFSSETRIINRSKIQFALYNPRIISDEGKKQIKRSVKKYGMLGGIVINSHTENTVVSGHQRISVLDEMAKYNPETHDNDYQIKAEFIDVDIKTEKQLNVLLNNPNVGGEYDSQKLRELIPDIDYKDAGLTDADLSLIGCDYLFKTEDENNLSDAIDTLTAPIKEEKAAEKEAKTQHMKDVKAKVKEAATEQAEKMDSYIMLTFDTLQAKEEFLQRFGYTPDMKFIKGEDFDERCEAVLD